MEIKKEGKEKGKKRGRKKEAKKKPYKSEPLGPFLPKAQTLPLSGVVGNHDGTMSTPSVQSNFTDWYTVCSTHAHLKVV